MERDSPKTGVVFSSGFFGFYAHAGFLAAARELKVAPCGYAGTSSGAILAAMAASGMGDSVIRDTLFSLRKSDFWDPESPPVLLKKALGLFRGYTGYLEGKGFSRLLGKIPVKRMEDCEVPVVIGATNLTRKKEEIFTRGPLIDIVQASGSVPMLFKPVEMNGSLYVDGGMVDKAPVQALYDHLEPDRIIVHFIASDNLKTRGNEFLQKKMTPWLIHHLSINISRQEAYESQCDAVKRRGIEIIEVETDTPNLGPNTLEMGAAAYDIAKEATLKILSDKGF